MKEEYKTPETVRLAMNKYLKSDKGKATRQAWLDANKKKMTKYYSNYFKKRRAECRKNKICIRCFKNPVLKGSVQCKECLRRKDDDI